MPSLSLTTRTFLYSFLVIGLALVSSFVAVSTAIKGKVKDELRRSLLRQENVAEQASAQHRAQVGRLVSALSDSAALKAGLGLLRESPESRTAKGLEQIRRTLEAQLSDLGGQLGYDLAAIADPADKTIAAVIATSGVLTRVDAAAIHVESSSLTRVDGWLYETIRVPINLGAEMLGSLSLGNAFDPKSFGRGDEVALLFRGHVAATNLSPARAKQMAQHLASTCGASPENCEFKLDGETYLAVATRRATFGDGYSLIRLQSLDAATKQFTRGFGSTYLLIGALSLVMALAFSAVVSRSIAGPIRDLVKHLGQSQVSRELRSDFKTDSPTFEVNQLAGAFNSAAEAIRESHQSLEKAYLEFIETMAQALDARDPYTAGHSERVSEYAIVIGRELGCSAEEVERIRVGAKLHDIGKIGIPDAVLQKPGMLTSEEFALIKQHPQIGRRILEQVGKFREYIPIVELHHEDHNGGGYPYGLAAEQIPLEARIVHVADVYDALTSDRSYRKRMPMSEVKRILSEGRGRQFDPKVVNAFFSATPERFVETEGTGSLLPLLARTTADRTLRDVEETVNVEITKSA